MGLSFTLYLIFSRRHTDRTETSYFEAAVRLKRRKSRHGSFGLEGPVVQNGWLGRMLMRRHLALNISVVTLCKPHADRRVTLTCDNAEDSADRQTALYHYYISSDFRQLSVTPSSFLSSAPQSGLTSPLVKVLSLFPFLFYLCGML